MAAVNLLESKLICSKQSHILQRMRAEVTGLGDWAALQVDVLPTC